MSADLADDEGTDHTGRWLVRNHRAGRWLHGLVYATTFAAGITGIALWGETGVQALAEVLGGHARAATLHRWTGYAVGVPPLVALLLRPRAVLRFLRDISRFDRGDGAWLKRLPGFIVAPARWHLPRHRGHFDPGQRLMAWGLVLSLAVVFVSGLLMVFAVDLLGTRYGLVLRSHTISSVVLAVLVVLHIGVSGGLPVGYRGAWRAMHAPAGGRVTVSLARQLWPEWTDERMGTSRPQDEG